MNGNNKKPPVPPVPPGAFQITPETKWIMIIQSPVESEPCAVALNEQSGITFQEAALLAAQALPIIIQQALVNTKSKEKSRIHIPKFTKFGF